MNQEKRDEKIREEILLEMRFMPVIEPGSIGVAVDDGVVTLTGHDADHSARQAAEQLARRVLGVRSVANEIQVHRPSIDSRQEVGLTRAVIDAFARGHQTLN